MDESFTLHLTKHTMTTRPKGQTAVVDVNTSGPHRKKPPRRSKAPVPPPKTSPPRPTLDPPEATSLDQTKTATPATRTTKKTSRRKARPWTQHSYPLLRWKKNDGRRWTHQRHRRRGKTRRQRKTDKRVTIRPTLVKDPPASITPRTDVRQLSTPSVRETPFTVQRAPPRINSCTRRRRSPKTASRALPYM